MSTKEIYLMLEGFEYRRLENASTGRATWQYFSVDYSAWVPVPYYERERLENSKEYRNSMGNQAIDV